MNAKSANPIKCELCEYEWQPRVQAPKSCPRCKRRFDYQYSKYVNFARSQDDKANNN